MFYVVCPNCNAHVEILENAIGRERSDLWNVNWCDQCGISFDYDDDEILTDDEQATA
jgi:hypothetical protein